LSSSEYFFGAGIDGTFSSRQDRTWFRGLRQTQPGSLKRSLEKQVAIYEAANRTRSSVKVIVYYTEQDEARVKGILNDLNLASEESIVLIDARSDNKPSGSKA
jgi:hypothetical protein